MKCVIPLLALSLWTQGRAEEWQCPASMECRVFEKCPDFLRQHQRLDTLARGTDQRRSLVTWLQTWVCDIDPKKVCCTINTAGENHSGV